MPWRPCTAPHSRASTRPTAHNRHRHIPSDEHPRAQANDVHTDMCKHAAKGSGLRQHAGHAGHQIRAAQTHKPGPPASCRRICPPRSSRLLAGRRGWWLSPRNSSTKAGQNAEIALPAPVDPWHCRTACRNQGESVGAHTASDAVCAHAIRPLVGLGGRRRQVVFVAAEDQRRRAADNSPSDHPLPGSRRT